MDAGTSLSSDTIMQVVHYGWNRCTWDLLLSGVDAIGIFDSCHLVYREEMEMGHRYLFPFKSYIGILEKCHWHGA